MSAMEDLKATCAAISEAEMNEAGAKSIQNVIYALEHMTEQDPEGLEAALRQCKANGRLDDFYTAVGMAGQGASSSIGRGVEVMPTPGFVLKTQKLSDGKKIFVNICSSELLPLPALKKQLDEEGNEMEGVSMSLSIGPPREVVDKSGKPCTAYDAVCNPIVLEEANTDKTGAQRDELCQVILKRIEVKYSETLNPQYKLPRVSYIGTVVPQRIRDTSKDPIIEEIAPPVKGSGGSHDPVIRNTVSIPTKECSQPPQPPPIYRNISYTLNGIWKDRRKDITSLSLEDNIFQQSRQEWPSSMELDLVGFFPQDCTLENLEKFHVKISPFEACIDVAGYNSVSVLFPFVTLPGTAVCEMNPHEQLLVLRVSVDMHPIDAGPDPGSHPWMLTQALSGGNTHQDNGKKTQSQMNNSEPPPDLQKNSVDAHDRTDDAFQDHTFNLGYGALRSSSLPSDLGLEDEELPEDKFHQNDALSRHILQQRQQQQHISTNEYSAKGCINKHKLRADDPGIEYIDVDQFKEENSSDDTLLLSEKASSKQLDQVVGKHSLESKLWTTLL